MDYKKKESTVNNQTRMTLKMVRNGGWAGTIKMK
jgi:alpha-glucosidase